MCDAPEGQEQGGKEAPADLPPAAEPAPAPLPEDCGSCARSESARAAAARRAHRRRLPDRASSEVLQRSFFSMC